MNVASWSRSKRSAAGATSSAWDSPGARSRCRTWRLDEMPYLLWRAVDEHGAELDVLVQKGRDTAVDKRFFRRVLRSTPVPRKIVSDQLRGYPTAKADILELAQVKHVFVKAAARVNNRAENSSQPTRRRERQMFGFRDARHTQAILSRFGPISGNTSRFR